MEETIFGLSPNRYPGEIHLNARGLQQFTKFGLGETSKLSFFELSLHFLQDLSGGLEKIGEFKPFKVHCGELVSEFAQNHSVCFSWMGFGKELIRRVVLTKQRMEETQIIFTGSIKFEGKMVRSCIFVSESLRCLASYPPFALGILI